jgi:hypothetical protein
VAANNGAFSYVGTAGLGIYIWGAQFTESAKPLPYVKTLDVAVTKTFAETLRTEYDVVTGENLGALIEGSSTNLFLNSESVNLWYNQYSSIETNAALAPDNTLSADKITDTSEIQEHFVESFTINQINGTFTASAYVKKNVGDTIQFRIVHVGQAPNTSSVIYYYDTDTFSSAEGVIDSVKSQKINNGWVKISVTYTIDNAVTYHRVRFHTISGTVAGTGTSAYIWGAQCEALPFASSYIRTEGAAVSRSSDNLNIDGNSSIPEGGQDLTVSIDVSMNDAYNHQSYSKLFRLDGQPLYMQSYATGVNNWMVYTNGLSLQLEPNISSGVTHSFTTTYTPSKIAAYFNSVETDTTTTFAPLIYNRNSTLSLGASGSSQHIDGHISKFSTYAQALTAQEITLL